MHSFSPWLSFIGELIFALAIIAVALRLILKWVRQVLRQRLAEVLDPAAVILLEDFRANYFGRESLGGFQLRGNGVLVLTDTSLEFLMLWPRRHFRIPLADITGVAIVRSHCGKTIGRDLLKVFFQSAEQADAMAWFVPEAQSWKNHLDAAVGR